MDYSAAAAAAGENPIEVRALESLGLGFDLASDFRIKFAKQCPDDGGGGRLIVLDETNKRDIVIPGCGVTISGVSEDIRCDKGDRIRFKSDVLEFNQVDHFISSLPPLAATVFPCVLHFYFFPCFNFYTPSQNERSEFD